MSTSNLLDVLRSIRSLEPFLTRISRHLPSEYHFTPRTWLLPHEYNIWYSYASTRPKNGSSAYILKPNNGAMGHGWVFHRPTTSADFSRSTRIQVFCDYERIQPVDNYIIQEYIREPYLIDGYKFGEKTLRHILSWLISNLWQCRSSNLCFGYFLWSSPTVHL